MYVCTCVHLACTHACLYMCVCRIANLLAPGNKTPLKGEMKGIDDIAIQYLKVIILKV